VACALHNLTTFQLSFDGRKFTMEAIAIPQRDTTYVSNPTGCGRQTQSGSMSAKAEARTSVIRQGSASSGRSLKIRLRPFE
jgi:hypothetical protein